MRCEEFRRFAPVNLRMVAAAVSAAPDRDPAVGKWYGTAVADWIKEENLPARREGKSQTTGFDESVNLIEDRGHALDLVDDHKRARLQISGFKRQQGGIAKPFVGSAFIEKVKVRGFFRKGLACPRGLASRNWPPQVSDRTPLAARLRWHRSLMGSRVLAIEPFPFP